MHVRIAPIDKNLNPLLAFDLLPSEYSLNSLNCAASVVLDHQLGSAFGLATSCPQLFLEEFCLID